PATANGRASNRRPRPRGSSRRILAKSTGVASRSSSPLSLAPAWTVTAAATAATGEAASRQPRASATGPMLRLRSTEQPGGDFSNVAPLDPGAAEFDPRRLPGTIAGGDRGGPVRAAAGDFLERILALEAVGQADGDQAEVHQVGQDGEQGHLLTTVLGSGRGERTAHLPVQGARGPQAATLVEEVGHLRSHPAEAGTAADDDRVV